MRKKVFLPWIFCWCVFPAFLSVLSGCSREKTPRPITPPRIELHAVKYGMSVFPSRFIFHNGDSGKEDFAWLFYLIRFNEKTILVDTGFQAERFTRQFRIEYRDPVEILSEIGVREEDVTDIILTHNHFDHIGNIHRFPNAVLYIQEQELNLFRENPSVPELLPYVTGHENIITFKDEYVLYGTFFIQKIGGHSPGSSVVSFRHGNTEFIITGDECYLPENYLEQIPVGLTYNLEKNRRFLRSLKQRKAVVLTMHDPGLMPRNLSFFSVIPARAQ